MPFIFGQLGNCDIRKNETKSISFIAEFKEAQGSPIQQCNNAMAVNIDLGTDGDGHFPNK